METFAALMNGFAVALTPQNLLFGFLGVTLGTMVGVLPGIGPALTVALLLPLTFKVDATAAFIMFAGLLRRDVRRQHHVHIAQYARRERQHHHQSRG